MKVLVLPFKIFPMPVCREDDVVVKVKSVGFCGTDGPILAGTRVVPWPLIPGHEFAGDIVEVGSKVEGWKVGDRVSACIVIGCGNCKILHRKGNGPCATT